MDDNRVRKAIEQQLDQYGEMVARQLVAMKWEDLVVAEQEAADFLLFKDSLRKRKRNGTWEEVPVMFHPLRNHEKRAARKAARDMAAADGIDPDKDPDIFADIDSVCILHLALRNTTDPYEPLCGSPKELEKRFDRETLNQAFAILDKYSALLDPQLSNMTREQFIACVAAITEGRSIRPLVAFDGPSQAHCVITMASILHSLLITKSLPDSSEPLMPAPSATSSSTDSQTAPT